MSAEITDINKIGGGIVLRQVQHVRAGAEASSASASSSRCLPSDRVATQYNLATVVNKTLCMIKDADALTSCSGEVVLVCGDTGSGKSTLLNLLSGAKLEAQKPYNSAKLRIECISESVSQIGHSLMSETTMPSKVSVQDVAYWDCPGFNDSRGPVVDISNAFYINKLLTASDKVKIIIVADEASINGSNRGQAFKFMVSRLGELFENTEDLVNGLCLVFTKVRDIDDFRLELQNIVDTDKTLGSEESRLLSAIIARSKIATFRLPTQIGPILDSVKDDIISQITSTQYISKPNVNITVSKDSLIILSRLVGEVDKKIGDASKSLSDKVLFKLDTLSPDQIKAIKGKLDVFATEYYTEGRFQSYVELVDCMKSTVFDTILAMPNFAEVHDSVSRSLTDLKNLVGYFDQFFTKIIPDVSIDSTKLQKAFLELSTEIRLQEVKHDLKGNKEALGKAQADIQSTAEASRVALANQSRIYDQQVAAQNTRIAQLAQDLQNAQTAAANAQAAAANSARVSAAQIAQANAKIKEIESRPPQIEYRSTGGGRSGGRCMIL